MKHPKKPRRKNQRHTKSDVQRIVFRMGKRIYLRPVLAEDIPFITVWINDPEITQFLKASYPIRPEDEKKWHDGLSDRSKKDVIFAIVLEATDELIGIMALHKIDHHHGTSTTGSFIGRKDLWSKGYGTEAKMLVLEYAFNTLGLRKICSSVYDFNQRSARCLEKCGYIREGHLKASKWRNGSFVDEYLYSVFREDFLPLWKKYHKEYLTKK